MALMKLSKELLSLHGRFGGVYYKHDRYGQHAQAMPRFIRGVALQGTLEGPQFPFLPRGDYTSAFTKMAALWRTIVTTGIMGYWTNFAIQNLYRRKDGTQIKLCPRAWFCHYNVKRIYLEENVWYYPPRTNWETPPYYSAGHAFGEWGNPLYQVGDYAEKPLYKFAVGTLFLWWDEDMWWISSMPGDKQPNYNWFRPSEEPEGTYIPLNPVDEGLVVTS